MLLLRPLTPMHYVIRHRAVDDARFWRDPLNPVESVRLLIKQATSDSVDFQLLKRRLPGQYLVPGLQEGSKFNLD